MREVITDRWEFINMADEYIDNLANNYYNLYKERVYSDKEDFKQAIIMVVAEGFEALNKNKVTFVTKDNFKSTFYRLTKNIEKELLSNHSYYNGVPLNKLELVNKIKDAQKKKRRHIKEYKVIDSAEDKALSQNAKEELNSILGILTQREKEVITMYFNLDGNGEYTMRQLGKIYGVCGARIQDILRTSFRKLRREIYKRENEELLKLIYNE